MKLGRTEPDIGPQPSEIGIQAMENGDGSLQNCCCKHGHSVTIDRESADLFLDSPDLISLISLILNQT
jgi:hypothetical protein